MKNEEKTKVVRLRSELGLSINEILKSVKVSKGTVSRWIQNVPLSQDQTEKLKEKIGHGSFRASLTHKRLSEERVFSYKEEGRIKAKEKNLLHACSCMLYWAEGHKKNNKNTVAFSNSNPSMVRLFLRFLKEQFDVPEQKISININCYTDIKGSKEIESYWLRELGLPESCLRKTMINKISKASHNKRVGYLEYGTCRLVVNDTSIINHIYGAIEEYSKNLIS